MTDYHKFLRSKTTEVSNWPINIDGEHCVAIKNYLTDPLRGNISPENVFGMVENMAKVLSFCPDPNKADKVQNTGLVIGKVQSGKTSNFITLTSLAFDNGYNIVIIFGGTKKNLLKQNSDRISEEFEDQEDVRVLSSSSNLELLNSTEINKFLESKKPKIIIVALKHAKHIKEIRKIFNNTRIGNQEPVLIIDDEGDEASLNTKFRFNGESSTYHEIIELKECIKRNSFITVTATPQANILLSSFAPKGGPHELTLTPDYGALCPPGEGYCGLSVFHSENSPYTVTIPEKEELLTEAKGVCESYVNCLYDFFIACGVYQFRGMKAKDKLAMLVNPSPNISDHNIVYRKTQELQGHWSTVVSNKNDITYDKFAETIKTYYDHQNKYDIDFAQIRDYVFKAIKTCGIHKINGETVNNNNDENYDFNIYIGGNMLGRGITLSGLAITYNLRETKGKGTVDTIQQRARWFGYKRKLLPYCRIYAPRKVLEQYEEIREHEDELWKTIEDADLKGKNFRNIVRLFSLSDDLNLTRRNVADAKRYSFDEWKKQKWFTSNASVNQNNIQLIQNYFADHAADAEMVSVSNEAKPFKIIRNIDLRDFYSDFLYHFEYNKDEVLDDRYIKKLLILLQKKELYQRKIDVIWMRYDEKKIGNSHHTIRENSSIPNYMVGKRTGYKGDDKNFIIPNKYQIQFHFIVDTRISEAEQTPCPVFAFHIPKEDIELLTGLVIRPEDDVKDD